MLDDDDCIVRICIRVLSDLGLKAVTAGTLGQARLILKTEAIDMVISDLGLPDGDGLDLLAPLRTDRPSLPMIVVTGAPPAGSRERASALGIRHFLLKPFEIEDLKMAVGELHENA